MSEDGALLEAWVAWLESQPPEIGRELASSLARLWPAGALRSSLVTTDPLAGFAPRLRRLPGSPLEAVGLVVLLAALTDLVLRERADPAAWEETDALLDALGEASSMTGLDATPLGPALDGFAERARARAPLRQRQWARVAESWRLVREGPLAPSRLDASLRAARRPTPPSNRGPAP